MLPIIREHRIRNLGSNDNFHFLPYLWENFFDNISPLTVPGNLDVYEDEKNLYVEAELPGYQRDQIELTLEDGLLSLSAEHSQKDEKKKENYYVRERSHGKWSRTVQLPIAVQEDNIKAVFKDGVLKITMEKQSQPKAHKIEVK